MAVTGTGANRVLLVFPSRREADHYMVDRLLKRAGCKREDFYILTLEDVDQTPAGFALTDTNVRAVVALGEAAQAVVLGETDVLRWRGRFVKFAGSDRCWATSTFLPSDLTYANFTDHEDKGLRHPPRYQGVWALDLLRALNVAKNGYSRVPGNYLLDPSPDKFEDWVAEFERAVDTAPDSVWLSWDIETPYKLKTKNEEDMESEEEVGDTTILRISFSYRLKTAVTVPWTGPYMRGIRRLLGSRCWKIVWNGRIFDVPIVTAAGVPVMGEVIDGMDAWHFLHSDLDKGLEFVTSFYSDLLPWKHLSNADPLLYSAIDADAALHNTLGTIEDLMKQDRWEAFYNDGHAAMKVFDEAAARGNLIDLELRSKYLTEWTETQTELVAKIQPYVPDQLRPRKRYKKLPKADDGPVFEAMVPTGVITAALYADGRKFVPVETQGKFKRCSACGKVGVTKGEHFKALPAPEPPAEEDLFGPKPKKKPKKPKKQPNPCKAAGAVIETVEGAVTEWDELLPFNPNSSEQLKAYMRHHGHPLGKHKKDEKKETAEAKHLKKLIGLYGDGFPLYALAYEAKKIGGAISKYLKVEPDANSRIHTVYTNSPTTWRTGSRGGPHATNMQNWGKRDSNPYAKKARAIIVPEPGYSFVQADSSSIEAVFVGYEMGDAQYLDLATKGIHDWLVCQMLGWEFNEESKAKIKAEHGALRDQMKFTNHMCLTGDHEVLTPQGWVRFDAYDFETPIAEWDGITGQIAFQSPQAGLVRPWEGELLEWEGRAFSAAMTPNHHLPVYYDNAQPLPYYEQAQHVRPTGRLPLTGQLAGGTEDGRVQLMVALQADGCVLEKGAVQFRFTRPRKITRMRQLAEGRAYTERIDAAGVTTFYFPAAAIADVVALLPEKTFSLERILQWDAATRQTFLDELPKWDGHEATRSGEQTCYVTMNGANAATVQTIAHVSGRQALVRQKANGLWVVSFNRRQRVRVGNLTRTTRPFKGTVYCVTTSTGYFLVRRNGKVWVSANTNYGGTPKMMVETHPDVFKTEADAKKCQGILFKLLPQLKEWQHQVRVRAQKENFLQSPFKARHYFYDVFSQKDGKIRKGKDANRAIAFIPQNGAGMFGRQNVRLLGDTWLRPYMPANIFVHDGYCVSVPDHLVEQAADMLEAILTRPIPELGGLRVGCEIEVGKNWKDMKTIRKVVIPATLPQQEAA